MKKLSDYKDEEAIELWADLIDPIVSMFDKTLIANMKGKPPLIIAKEMVKTHPKEVSEILLRIDPTPIDGMNVVMRLVTLLSDIGNNEEMTSFFGFALQGQSESEFSGSATENTGDGVK